MRDGRAFAELLRGWRARRGWTQLRLAHEAEVSQRHISFLELGRSAPSRSMVLRLALALDIPFREQNDLLLAAGLAPQWRDGSVEGPGMEMVDRAIDYMLGRHDPYPAFVLDRHWNLLRANASGRLFAGILTGGAPVEPDPSRPVNLADALMAPEPMRRKIRNWREVARYFLRTVRTDSLADGAPETRALLERLMSYPGVPEIHGGIDDESNDAPVLVIDVRHENKRLRVFTTLATMGTPLSVTSAELRIEYFFPADAATEAAFRAGDGES